MKSNQSAEGAVWSLIKHLKVKVSDVTIKKSLRDHPNYPSLFSITSSLKEWNIDNYAHVIDKKELNIKELELPFIAYLSNSSSFVFVEKLDEKSVSYTHKKKKKTISLDHFMNIWHGVALHATANKKSGEAQYIQNFTKSFLQRSKLPVSMILFCIFLFLYLSNFPINIALTGLIFLKLMGVAVSVLLLTESIDANNPFIEKLCNLGGNDGCNNILNSNAAKVTTWLTWSEVGFFYFAGSLLSILISPSSLLMLKWLNILALPYTIYSVAFQYKVKNWCVLCCSIQAILVLEAVAFFFSQDDSLYSFQFNNIVSLIFSLVFPIITWSYLKPFFLAKAELSPLKQQLRNYKYDITLFEQALKNQPRYAVSESLFPIIMGNSQAKNVVTLISNPFCGPCSRAHQLVENWLDSNDDIQLKVIFSVKNKDGDKPTKAAKHLVTINKTKDKVYTETAVSEWYRMNTNDYENWSKNFPVDINDEADEIIKRQREWCDLIQVSYTPTILINGFKLPNPYRLEDIKYFLS